MTYLQSQGVKFDFLDIDIDDIEDTDVKLYLERNRYDIVLTGSIVTHYKWMKWLTKTVRYYNPKSIIIVGNSVAGSIPTLFLTPMLTSQLWVKENFLLMKQFLVS